MSKKVHVKTGDTVIVINGKDRGKTGKVKHVKPRQMGEPGGIIKAESAMYAEKVQLICPKCGKPTRVGHVIDGDKKLRLCKKCGAHFQ